MAIGKKFKSWCRCNNDNESIIKNALHYFNPKIRSFDFTNIQHIGCSSFYGTQIEKVIFGLNTKTIGSRAFSNCIKMGPTLLFPPGLKEIGIRSFENCYLIKEVFIPSSIELIEQEVFRNCKNLEKIIIDKNLTDLKIEKNAFYGCPASIHFKDSRLNSDEETISVQ